MATMIVSPGTNGAYPTLNLKVMTGGTDEAPISSDTTGLDIATMQDVTVNAANDVFTWTQLNKGGKLQIPTTSTNSISLNMVVDNDVFFGTGTGSTAANKGVFGLSNEKTKVIFSFTMASSEASDKVISGVGYITGLAPSVSADSPVWVTPVTITVLGEFDVA